MMTLRLSKPNTKARFLLIGYGLVLLIWLSLEDRSVLTVSLLGTGSAIVYLGTWLINRFSEQGLTPQFWFFGIVLSGAVLGAASTLVTAILMFFKSSWHGHLYPDYPPQMIATLLTRMPIWSLSGLLFGLCCAVVLLLRQRHSPIEQS